MQRLAVGYVFHRLRTCIVGRTIELGKFDYCPTSL